MTSWSLESRDLQYFASSFSVHEFPSQGPESGWNSSHHQHSRQQEGEGGEEKKEKKTFLPAESAPLNTPFILLLLTARKFDSLSAWPIITNYRLGVLNNSGSGSWEDQGADKVGFIRRILLLACRCHHLGRCSCDLCVSVRLGERLHWE